MDIPAAFHAHFGCEPEVIAQAPGRVNLIGEHIDYSDGFVLPFAIDSVTTVAICRREDQEVRLVSAQQAHEVVSITQTAIAERAGTG
ncbi:MAG: galactokinase family protein [Actinomycetota bacterium]